MSGRASAAVASGLAALAATAVAVAAPSPPYEFAGSVAGNSDDPNTDGATPGNTRGSTNPLHYNDHPVTVPSEGANQRMRVRISWENPSDWDLLVFRDTNGDGRAQSTEPLEGSSEQDTGTAEEVEVDGLVPNERYVARVVNFSAHTSYSGTVTYLSQECFNRAPTIASNAELVPGTGGADVILTGDAANAVVADTGNDRVCTGVGKDFVRGDRGDDRVDLGGGKDKASGGGLNPNSPSGDDVIKGGAGDDELNGHDGSDVIDGGPGTDICRGGPGVDEIRNCEN